MNSLVTALKIITSNPNDIVIICDSIWKEHITEEKLFFEASLFTRQGYNPMVRTGYIFESAEDASNKMKSFVQQIRDYFKEVNLFQNSEEKEFMRKILGMQKNIQDIEDNLF